LKKKYLNWQKTLGREFVIQVKGTVIEREAKTKHPTGELNF
jgi:aspartyl-tRNA synthetase